jgi:hypothetical protein
MDFVLHVRLAALTKRRRVLTVALLALIAGRWMFRRLISRSLGHLVRALFALAAAPVAATAAAAAPALLAIAITIAIGLRTTFRLAFAEVLAGMTLDRHAFRHRLVVRLGEA